MKPRPHFVNRFRQNYVSVLIKSIFLTSATACSFHNGLYLCVLNYIVTNKAGSWFSTATQIIQTIFNIPNSSFPYANKDI